MVICLRSFGARRIKDRSLSASRLAKAVLSKFVTVMGVEKEVLRAGTGPGPAVGQDVDVHCTGFGKNGDLSQKFWSTKDPGQKPFSFKIGQGSVIKEDKTGRDCGDFEKWHNGGANVHIGSGTVIGPDVMIGQSTTIGYNVALTNCTIGDSCVIHNGVCIGQDGFGFYVDEHGNMVKKPQMLKARIGNHVEIGANSCVDRGSWRDTTVGDNSKIDNLVQIGHNVVIGKNCMLCGQVGIAGSVTVGDYVTFGGRVAVRDHVSIASKVRLAANSCVTKDIGEPGDYGGFPAVSIHEWRRQLATRRHNLK